MRNYYRQFVTLLQERPGYAMSGKQAVGRIVIEARDDMARATVYIQDLSPQSTYKLAFVSRAEESNLGVVVGSIIVDERGRYEGKFEFNRANIGGSGITCEGIDACVIFLSSDEEEFTAPLAGYRAQPFSWRVNLSFPDGREESPILEVKQIEEVVEVIQEVTETVEEISPEAVEVVEEVLEETTKESIEIEETPLPVYDFVVEEPVSDVFVAEEPVAQDDISLLFHNDNIVEIFSYSDRYPDAQWVVTNLQSIQIISDDVLKNPLVGKCYEKHRHVLLGRNAENNGHNTYILGVPDVFDITVHTNEHEFNSLFDSFKLCNPSDPIKGAHGYWLKKL